MVNFKFHSIILFANSYFNFYLIYFQSSLLPVISKNIVYPIISKPVTNITAKNAN